MKTKTKTKTKMKTKTKTKMNYRKQIWYMKLDHRLVDSLLDRKEKQFYILG